MEARSFEIDAERVVRWKETSLVVGGLFLFGVGALVVRILLRLGLRNVIRAWAHSLRYELRSDALCVYSRLQCAGLVLHEADRAIPLTRITDLKLVRGPILARMDMWQVQVQTAGRGTPMAEACLHGLRDPHEVRELVLERVAELTG